MAAIETLGGETLLPHNHGHEVISILVRDPSGERLTTVRMTLEETVELASSLTGMLLDRGAPEPGAYPS